jgi:putative hemolysin
LSSDPLGPLLLQVVLIAVNAFFAATEIAVISLNDNKLRRQAEAGDRRSIVLLKIVQEPTSFLSTIQIGITLAGYLGAAFAADNFAVKITHYFTEIRPITFFSANVIHSLSVIIITVILSFFTLVFGELVPKRIAMQKPEPVARFASGFIVVLTKIVKPIIWVLSITTNGLLRLLRIDPEADVDEVSEEEIRYMVDMGEEKGAIEASEKQMITNIFDFNNMTAEDVMIHRTDMEVIKSGCSTEEIINIIKESGYSRFPVIGEDADDVEGILIAKEYLLNLYAKPDKKREFEDLLRPAYFVPESVRTDILFNNMKERQTHMAIVVDEYGGVNGLVTIEDLLEEIVGSIYDESDLAEAGDIIPLGEGIWRIAGNTELTEIIEELDVIIPESDEFETLSGMVMDHLGAVPDDGETPEINLYGLNIQVESIKDRRIEAAIVSKIIEEPILEN